MFRAEAVYGQGGGDKKKGPKGEADDRRQHEAAVPHLPSRKEEEDRTIRPPGRSSSYRRFG